MNIILTYRRDVHPFETDTKGRHSVVDVYLNWATNRNWQTKVLDTRTVTQLNLPRQESVHPLDYPVASVDVLDSW